MHILLIIAILVFISSTMPVLAKGLTALITFGFLAPIFIIGVGAMSWLAIHAMGGNIDGDADSRWDGYGRGDGRGYGDNRWDGGSRGWGW